MFPLMIAWACKKFNTGFFSDKESKNENKTDTSKHSMLVEDEPSCSHKVKLTVVGLEGHVWTLEVPANTSIEKLKTSILSHFHSSNEGLKLSANYYLVTVGTKQILDAARTVIEENLRDNDEILLVERNSQPKKTTQEDERGPTLEEIEKATKHLVPQNVNRPVPNTHRPEDFQSDIQKMFISLTETSARILSVSPEADEIYEVISSKNAPDPQVVGQLVDMGFSQKQVLTALAMKKQNPAEALECLLDGSCESFQSSEFNIPSNVDLTSPEIANLTLAEKINRFLKIMISSNSKRNNNDSNKDKMLEFLMNTGLAQSNSVDILRKSDSEQTEFTDVSLKVSEAEEKTNLGLNPEDPIYKALHSNPAIILGLSNPKTLLALLSIVDSPSAANLWLNDPDTSPVLNLIFKTYHTEKHAVSR